MYTVKLTEQQYEKIKQNFNSARACLLLEPQPQHLPQFFSNIWGRMG